ncbi:solute carrier family 13 member 4-like [Glandiceps talaboti]
MASYRHFLNFLICNRRLLCFVLTPVVLSPFLFAEYEDENDAKASKAAFVLILFCTYVVTVTLPLAVAGMIPILLLPTMSIMSIDDVAANYFKEFHLMLVGVLIISSAVEKHQLHRRIALRTLLLAGSDPKWLLLAVMSCSGFLSMWIFNIPLTTMMLPIVSSLVEKFEQSELNPDKDVLHNEDPRDMTVSEEIELSEVIANNAVVDTTDDIQNGTIGPKNDRMSKEEERASPLDKTSDNRNPSPLAICFNTGLAYSASIGGVGSLIGNGLLLIMLDITESCCSNSSKTYTVTKRKLDKEGKSGIAADGHQENDDPGPTELKSFSLANKKDSKEKSEIAVGIQKEYDALGPIKWAEVVVLVMFAILILVWFFEEPRFIPGWKPLFKEGYVTATCVCYIMVLLCFIVPASGPSFQEFGGTAQSYSPLIEWGYAQRKVNWGILVFIGGIQCLSEVVKDTGLAAIIGEQFYSVQDWPAWVVLLFFTTVATILTEFTSGSIIITVLMPVIQAVIKSGILMNIICLTVNNVAMNTYGRVVLQLDEIPEWATAWHVAPTNGTVTTEISTVP